MSSPKYDVTGGCLCGAIRFRGVAGDQQLVACHCSQCRRWSGHFWASMAVNAIEITGSPAWFRSSDVAQRGFCRDCGSALFWRGDGDAATYVALGSVDQPSGRILAGHIYVADKGDYYDLNDQLPKAEGAR